MLNTMTEAQLLKYSHERNAIKYDMAAETEQLKIRSLSDLTMMKKDETVDEYINIAEGLKNKCQQLGKDIEGFELRMFILKGLRAEFEPNVRILESQTNVTINNMRYALKQEELRREKGRVERDNESVRKVRESTKNDVNCFKCGKRDHFADQCHARKRCFNSNGADHIAAECRTQRQFATQRGKGNGYRGNARGRGYRGQERRERIMQTVDERVMRVRESAFVNKSVYKCGAKQNSNENIKNCDNMSTVWLLDSGHMSSHMSSNVDIYDKLESNNREITLADKSGKKIASNGIGEIVVEQKNIESRIRLSNVLDLNSNLLSVAKITDHGYKVEFKNAVVYDDRNQIKVRAVRKGNAYYVKTDIVNNERVKAVQDSEMWYRRLGHINKDLIEEMKEKDLVQRMDRINERYKQCMSEDA